MGRDKRLLWLSQASPRLLRDEARPSPRLQKQELLKPVICLKPELARDSGGGEEDNQHDSVSVLFKQTNKLRGGRVGVVQTNLEQAAGEDALFSGSRQVCCFF